MAKEVISITQTNRLSDLWHVHYRAEDNRIYWKSVRAKDEIGAFMKVMGIHKPPQPKDTTNAD